MLCSCRHICEGDYFECFGTYTMQYLTDLFVNMYISSAQ